MGQGNYQDYSVSSLVEYVWSAISLQDPYVTSKFSATLLITNIPVLLWSETDERE